MTVEPQRTPRRRDFQGDGTYENAQSDDQSELLRWRADQLLDEMMLGGVDVSAADLDGRPVDSPAAHTPENGSYANGHHSRPTNGNGYSGNGHNGNGHSSTGHSDAGHSDTNQSGSDHRDTDHSGNGSYYAAFPDAGPATEGGPQPVRRSDGPATGSKWPSQPSGDEDDTSYATGSHSPDSSSVNSVPQNSSGDNHSRPGSHDAGKELDIYFDAFEEAPPRKSATRPPLDTPGRSASTSGSDSSSRRGNGQDGSERAINGGYSSASDPEEDIFAPPPAWPEPRSETYPEPGHETRYPESRTNPSRNAEGESRREGREPFIPSKINDADYLSRRYGYTGDDGDANGTTSREAYGDPLDRMEPTGRNDESAPGRGPRESSRIYYERQRVDREERMSSAERRPDQPMHANQSSADADRDDSGLGSGLGFSSRSELGEGRRSDSEPRERNGLRDSARIRRDDLTAADLSFNTPKPAAPEPEDTQWIQQAKEKWNWQDVSGVAEQFAPETSGAGSLYEFELIGYDRDPRISGTSQRVGAMSVANGKKRSNLLPRMSSTSVDTLHERMQELHEQIALMLPVGHEYRERAYHLLEKANSILQNDPMRSAEVEYYLQQVRGIVQRQEHAIGLSSLYHQRLTLYLGAWLAFSGVSLLARYVFQFEFDAFLAGTFGLDYAGFLLQNAAAFMGCLFAGALGGSIGALLTLARHTRQPHGYVDRKYGLRGLMLPIIGFLVGGVIYLPFAFFYSVIGLDPSLNVIAASIAAICAFAFGFNQESLYGTRD